MFLPVLPSSVCTDGYLGIWAHYGCMMVLWDTLHIYQHLAFYFGTSLNETSTHILAPLSEVGIFIQTLLMCLWRHMVFTWYMNQSSQSYFLILEANWRETASVTLFLKFSFCSTTRSHFNEASLLSQRLSSNVKRLPTEFIRKWYWMHRTCLPQTFQFDPTCLQTFRIITGSNSRNL